MKEPKTKKGNFNAIVREAEKLNAQLRQLQEKAQTLADKCREFGDIWDDFAFMYELADMAETLDDLAGFDLEDTIPEKATNNF